jgi:hypothetical protein
MGGGRDVFEIAAKNDEGKLQKGQLNERQKHRNRGERICGISEQRKA